MEEGDLSELESDTDIFEGSIIVYEKLLGKEGLAAFRRLADSHPNVTAELSYDEGLAKLLIEGGDSIFVPSRFEPCGLTQLYGLRYGTLPLVAYTGGLADTVIPASPAGLRAGSCWPHTVSPKTIRVRV